jgi:aldehyde:ferredoxin oxidoreductase
MSANDPLDRVLIIDLTKRRAAVEHRPDLFQSAVGGVGVATRLLQEECPDGADPLGPENPIIFAVGPLSGLFPLASKTVAMFKSPHTGNLGESHAGGRSAVAIRMAGYGAIVIRGASSSPIYLVIDGDKVHFRDARAMWGMHSAYATGSIIRDREAGAGMRTIMRIGPAGEKCVSYASVITETYRHFGRLGLGAVFGSKKLKGLVVSGVRSLPVADPKLYRKTYDEIFEATTESALFKKYHELGTAVNVLPMDAMGALPTRNLQSGSFEAAELISGERLAEEYLGRRVACAHCPVACIHLAAVRFPHPDQPYFYKTNMIAYDHEPLFAVGSMLGGRDGTHDTREMFRLLDVSDALGLDVMSMGCSLSWATEALERGAISLQDTDGLDLAWGDYPTYVKAAEKIVSQPNDFYAALARGAEYASHHYGGAEYALAMGGNEMAGYHTGPACYVGYLAGARNSHLDNAGYALDQKAAKNGGLTPEKVGVDLATEEGWRQVLNSLVICLFARNLYTPDLVQRSLKVAGLEMSGDDLTRLGQETLRLKHEFKRRCGFDLEGVRIPRRILETPTPMGQLDEGFIRQALQVYREAVLPEAVAA